MSASIVAKRHIDVLVFALTQAELLDTDPETTGCRLWIANVAAVKARYPKTDPDELPGPVIPGGIRPATYQYQPPWPRWSRDTSRLIQILKAVKCYQYQCDGLDVWETTWASERTEELRACLELWLPLHLQREIPDLYHPTDTVKAVYQSALYDHAAWDID